MTNSSNKKSGAEWRSAKALHHLYTVLAREFTLEIPVCAALEGDAGGSRKSWAAASAWFSEVDERIPVHQLRQFLQTSTLANEESLGAVLKHQLAKSKHNDSDRDKTDFLMVQFFSTCAPSLLEDSEVNHNYVAGVLEPILGKVNVSLPQNLEALEGLVQSANGCHCLKEVFASGVLEKGRQVKTDCGEGYFSPSSLVAFTRFNFLLRRIFFRLMHRDLNATLDGLRELEASGVNRLDCRTAEFSADEPVARLRMICQSWKVMFQAEYSFGQPMRMLVDLRTAVDAALAKGKQEAASPAAPVAALRAKAAAASGDAKARDSEASHGPGSGDSIEL
jgi:hypothetical protein